MNKKLGFWSIVLLTINSIIGTGIFLSPGGVAKSAGSLAPVLYICAAIFAAVLAVTFAAASKYVNKSGAAYAYTRAAFGEKPGLFVGITRFVSASIAWGVMATAVTKNALKIFGADPNNLLYVTIGFIILMGILFLVNIFGMKFLAFMSNISTVGKVAALAITIVAGVIVVLTTGQNRIKEIDTLTTEAGTLVVQPMSMTVFVTALISAFYAFTGFESVASGSGDMEAPEKNLPRAIPLAIGIIAAIYFGIVFVAMMINPVALVTSKEVVVLASVFENPIIQNIIIIGALVSMFGINIAASFHSPRLGEAMAKDGILPKIFAKRSKNDIPVNAFLLTAALAIIVPMSFQYDMQGIMIISSIARFVQFLVVPIAVMKFYYGKKGSDILDAPKNFITDVVIPAISLVLTCVLLYKFDWMGQFSVTNAEGVSAPNYFAISAMIIGYVVLPILFILTNKKKAN